MQIRAWELKAAFGGRKLRIKKDNRSAAKIERDEYVARLEQQRMNEAVMAFRSFGNKEAK